MVEHAVHNADVPPVVGQRARPEHLSVVGVHGRHGLLALRKVAAVGGERRPGESLTASVVRQFGGGGPAVPDRPQWPAHALVRHGAGVPIVGSRQAPAHDDARRARSLGENLVFLLRRIDLPAQRLRVLLRQARQKEQSTARPEHAVKLLAREPLDRRGDDHGVGEVVRKGQVPRVRHVAHLNPRTVQPRRAQQSLPQGGRRLCALGGRDDVQAGLPRQRQRRARVRIPQHKRAAFVHARLVQALDHCQVRR